MTSTRARQITFYVDDRTHAAIERLAAHDHQTLSGYMRWLTERHVMGEPTAGSPVAALDADKLHFVYLGMEALLRFQPWEKQLYRAVRDTHRIDTDKDIAKL